MSGATFSFFLLRRNYLTQSLDRNRLLVWKLSYKGEASSNRFYIVPQSGKQQVTSLLQTRYSFLAHVERTCHGLLSFIDRMPKLS